jgi:hypothetical protein
MLNLTFLTTIHCSHAESDVFELHLVLTIKLLFYYTRPPPPRCNSDQMHVFLTLMSSKTRIQSLSHSARAKAKGVPKHFLFLFLPSCRLVSCCRRICDTRNNIAFCQSAAWEKEPQNYLCFTSCATTKRLDSGNKNISLEDNK